MTKKAAHAAKMNAIHAAARAVLATGKCPQCGAGIKHNSALTGWIQCDQYGSEGFRKDSSKAPCSWQAFTE